MAVSHAKPSEVIDVRPLNAELKGAKTTTLIKTDSLEIIRLVVHAGKEIKRHEVPGEITIQCLEGKICVDAGNRECELTAGKLIYLAGADHHALRAIEDSSLLLTILLKHKAS